MEEEVWDKYKVEGSKKRGLQKQRQPAGMEACAKKQEVQDAQMGRKLLGKNLRLVQLIQLAASAKQAGGVNGRRRDEAAAKNEEYEAFDEENRSKGRMGCWRQTEKAWIHPGWEDTMQEWYGWLENEKGR